MEDDKEYWDAFFKERDEWLDGLEKRIERGKEIARVGYAMIKAALYERGGDEECAKDGARQEVFLALPQRNRTSPSKRPFKNVMRTKVFERDGYRCQVCGGWKALSVDHIFPESKGGDESMENLQTLCKSCNSRKGTKVS